jgi:hypothetical protein
MLGWISALAELNKNSYFFMYIFLKLKNVKIPPQTLNSQAKSVTWNISLSFGELCFATQGPPETLQSGGLVKLAENSSSEPCETCVGTKKNEWMQPTSVLCCISIVAMQLTSNRYRAWTGSIQTLQGLFSPQTLFSYIESRLLLFYNHYSGATHVTVHGFWASEMFEIKKSHNSPVRGRERGFEGS